MSPTNKTKCCALKLPRRLDLDGVRGVRAQLRLFDRQDIHLDASATKAIFPAGIQFLVWLRKKATGEQRKLRISNLSNDCIRQLDLLGFSAAPHIPQYDKSADI